MRVAYEHKAGDFARYVRHNPSPLSSGTRFFGRVKLHGTVLSSFAIERKFQQEGTVIRNFK